MGIRVRFAPSPTGHVHIGNIRVAIFNWLLARHEHGTFLLRIEDTDRERSTSAAITSLLDVMAWLGLDVDEVPLRQSSRRAEHLAAAQRLLDQGDAYRAAKGGPGEAVLLRIPWSAAANLCVDSGVAAERIVHTSVPVRISVEGLQFAEVSRKGKPMPTAACLAGFRGLEILDADGGCRFRLEDRVGDILEHGAAFTVEGAASLRFQRRHIAFTDLVKGRLAKPLDNLKDLVVVRSDGTPVFHLANVCDDLGQAVTHVIRGDDHVENTYRHLFLFAALGAVPPAYAHLPMIVNAAGKPYSKRDGDAFVGDFRAKGYLPEALINYLALLGWAPGGDREKLDRAELVRLFDLGGVQQAAAQMDLAKLRNLNGRYMAELPGAEFLECAREALSALPWGRGLDDVRLRAVARLMQSRTKTLADVAAWRHFFTELPEYDRQACRRFLAAVPVREALGHLCERLQQNPFTEEALEAVVAAAAAAAEVRAGSLNQPLRVAVTGTTVGAGIYETLAVLGREQTLARLRAALAQDPEPDAE